MDTRDKTGNDVRARGARIQHVPTSGLFDLKRDCVMMV